MLCLCVYAYTLAPTVTSEDSGELIAAAHFFGVPHPPGYPLWTILCGVFVKLVSLGSVAWRANLFSAVCAAASIGVLCRCLSIVGVGRCVALGTSLAVGFGAVLWSQSVVTEVYTLYGLMLALLLWAILKWYVTRRRFWLIIGSAFVGLGMCNHHLLGLSAVGLAAWVVLLKPRLLLDWKLGIACLVVLVACLTPYTYLLARARANPPMNWGEPKTSKALVDHANRRQYKRRIDPNKIRPKKTFAQYVRQARVIGRYCLNEHTPYLAAIGAVGLAYLSVRRRRLALLFVTLSMAHVVLFLKFHGIGQERASLWTSKVFFIAQYLALGLPLAFGVEFILGVMTKIVRPIVGFSRHDRMVHALAAVTVLVCVAPLAAHWKENNLRHYWYAYDHACNMLDSMLPDGIIVPSGDHNTFPLIYVTLVEGVRSDVTIADKYGYIDPELYRGMPGFEGRKPRSLAERNQIEEWVIRHARRPVYYTVRKQPLVPNADAVPVGLLYHLLPNSKTLDQDGPWESIGYRNLDGDLNAARDYGADNILADYEFFRALDQLRRGDAEAAKAHFARAAEYGFGVKEIYNNIGSALAEHGLAKEALHYFQLAADLDPKYATTRWNMARIYKALRDWPSAEAAFAELAEATPEDFRVFGELGFLGKILGAPPHVVQARFEESLRLNPSQPQIILELANHYRPEKNEAPIDDIESRHDASSATQPAQVDGPAVLPDPLSQPTAQLANYDDPHMQVDPPGPIDAASLDSPSADPSSAGLLIDPPLMTPEPRASARAVEGGQDLPDKFSVEPPAPNDATPAPPFLEFETLRWDFGEVPAGGTYTHDFAFTNTGDTPLKITDLHRSCTCATPRLEKSEYGPAEAGSISVSLRVGKKAKRVHQKVTLTTNSPAQPTFVLHVEAQVMPEIVPDPPTLTLTGVKAGSVINKAVKLTRNRDEPFTITSASSDDPAITVTIPEPEPASAQTLQIDIDPSPLPCRFRKEVTVKTSVPWANPITIPIEGKFTSPVAVSPAIVHFGNIHQGETRAREVTITLAEPTKLTLHPESETDALDLTLRQNEADRTRWTLTVRIRPDGVKPAPFFRMVRLNTGLTHEPVIEIPVYGEYGVRE